MGDTKASGPKPLSVVNNPQQLREQLNTMGWWKLVPHTTFSAHWLGEGEQRLDGGYYANAAFAALRTLYDSGFENKQLGHPDIVQEVFILGRFKRIYATDRKAGWPYLSASEALTFRPLSDRWIAKDQAPKAHGMRNEMTILSELNCVPTKWPILVVKVHNRLLPFI